MGHRRYVRRGLVDRVQHLVVEVFAHELVDPVVEGRGEQHPLSRPGGLIHDPGDDGEKTEVGHVVGLVEHGDLDGIERDELLLHEVFEPAGAGDDDVNAGLECCDLPLLRDPAEDGGDLEPVRSGQGLHRDRDLRGQFAGGREHEAERASGATLSTRQLAAEAGDHRNRECERLARSGLAAAEYVTAVQGVGKRVVLNRKRRVDSG